MSIDDREAEQCLAELEALADWARMDGARRALKPKHARKPCR